MLFDVLFSKTNGLTDAIAEVVQLRAANDGGSKDFDLGDARAVKRELAFDALTGDDTTNRKGLADAGTATRDNVAVEHLNTLFFALENLAVNVDAITDFKLGNVLFFGASFYQTDEILTHGNIPYVFKLQLRSALKTSNKPRRTKKKTESQTLNSTSDPVNPAPSTPQD